MDAYLGQMEDIWKKFEGKKVFIQTKNGRNYQGMVISLAGSFVIIVDKFSRHVCVDVKDLSVMQEES